MQRRSEELPLRAGRVPLLLLILFSAGGLLAAQEPGDAVRGFVGASTGLTRVRGATGVIGGVSALVELFPGWRAGGGGQAMLGGVTFGEGQGGESELRFGYGGVLVEWTGGPEDERGPTRFRLRLLAAAGNAELHRPPLGLSMESDNFVVLEPTVAAERRFLRRLSGGLSARYRIALAVDDLGGLESGDLSGATLGVELRLGPF